MRRFMLPRFSAVSALSALLLSAACGGEVTSPGASTTPPKTDGPDASCPTCTTTGPHDGSIAGSYELTFTSVARSDGKSGSGLPLPDARASITNRARLDVAAPKADGTVRVTLTGRWNDSAAFDGKVEAGKLVLRNGKATFGTGDAASTFNESNAWTELTFAIGGGGELAGTFDAKGELFASAGDVVESFPIAGAGTVATDARAPALKLAPPKKSRGGQWLPWDPIAIGFAEPLRRDALAPMLIALPEVAWPPTGDANAKPDDLITGLYGWATAYTTNGAKRTLTAPAGVTDPNKNPLEPFTADLQFRDVGAAKARHELDAGFASWGDVTVASDARCESGSCVVFAAQDQGLCGAPTGIAGRLATGQTFTKVHARVRVLAGTPQSADAEPLLVDPIRFEVTAGTEMKIAQLQQLPLTKSGAGDTPWQSAWTTIDLPVNAAEAGFSFVRAACDVGGGFPLPPAKVSLIVDAVWAD